MGPLQLQSSCRATPPSSSARAPKDLIDTRVKHFLLYKPLTQRWCTVRPSGIRSGAARHPHNYKERWKLRVYEDPLQDAIYNTWGEGVDDWGTEEYTEEQLIDVLYEDDNSPEGILQNILAITLTLLLAVALGGTLFRLTLVVWSLIVAAVRYTVVAILILFIFIFVLP